MTTATWQGPSADKLRAVGFSQRTVSIDGKRGIQRVELGWACYRGDFNEYKSWIGDRVGLADRDAALRFLVSGDMRGVKSLK